MVGPSNTMMRPLQAECLWRQDWTPPVELINAFAAGIAYDNAHDLYSSLSDKTSSPFEMAYQHRHSTPFVAA
jgi:hypothetical protein